MCFKKIFKTCCKGIKKFRERKQLKDTKKELRVSFCFFVCFDNSTPCFVFVFCFFCQFIYSKDETTQQAEARLRFVEQNIPKLVGFFFFLFFLVCELFLMFSDLFFVSHV